MLGICRKTTEGSTQRGVRSFPSSVTWPEHYSVIKKTVFEIYPLRIGLVQIPLTFHRRISSVFSLHILSNHSLPSILPFFQNHKILVEHQTNTKTKAHEFPFNPTKDWNLYKTYPPLMPKQLMFTLLLKYHSLGDRPTMWAKLTLSWTKTLQYLLMAT